MLFLVLEPFQELHSYEELCPSSPELCQRMQMKISSILLQSVYNSRNSCLQRARILLRKGRALRARGTEGLKDCIQCLSEAICVLVISLVLGLSSHFFIVDKTCIYVFFVTFKFGLVIT